MAVYFWCGGIAPAYATFQEIMVVEYGVQIIRLQTLRVHNVLHISLLRI
ncbi:YALI0E27313p [Yarrowia lipolytica CLIB122]|uniref:YALI0E27313p n=1 Tax=Yarrowia lipolytica (strain CLIB 122 / E 150) TaxID=284591 RepID=Q6C4F0_YARLI|nr:YALI0E27313p [Yarrowia lipolytica CLIB122]CAG80063.1 YALI0E27313p [Yarrowia lipolytica CLIB122]|eukprot:XP_504462.1 YALI0E27313p [Yarrowia lipolytica CLIB122]